jgi:hypothetical protein
MIFQGFVLSCYIAHCVLEITEYSFFQNRIWHEPCRIYFERIMWKRIMEFVSCVILIFFFKFEYRVWHCSSFVEQLTILPKALGLTPGTARCKIKLT